MAVLALIFALFSTGAHALSVSPHSLKIEDTQKGVAVIYSDAAKLERGELYSLIVVLGGHLDFYGESDQVIVLNGKVDFHAGSKLNKSLVVMGGEFTSESGSDLTAEKVVVQVPGPLWKLARWAGYLWRDNVDWIARACAGLVTCFLLWLLGWPLFYFFPALQAATEGSLARQWAKNLVVALIASIGSIVTGFVLLVSIIGWIVLPFYFLLLGFAAFASYLAAALWAGHRLLPPGKGRRIHPGGFFLGLLAFQFFWAVGVSFSWLPVLVLWTLSWGALARASAKLWK
jgi:hypothetical protein